MSTARCPPPAFSTTSNQLRRLNYTTKQLSSWNPDRNDARCAAWYARVNALYSRRQLLCIDEVGCNKKAANRTRGISKCGRPAVTHLNLLAGGRKYIRAGHLLRVRLRGHARRRRRLQPGELPGRGRQLRGALAVAAKARGTCP